MTYIFIAPLHPFVLLFHRLSISSLACRSGSFIHAGAEYSVCISAPQFPFVQQIVAM